ncbi:S-adenosyl-L-methionine-dependent methyltransferase [Halteromyces radiatus]|uniref:S-adenosyl-L-methionine-dependent methyltransferase n=1 Tax=Halteromyces radiatus TaxID=101107 RepID=UPI00221FB2FC|nr:S-adenosyl-L-methionine-dependent methyltransferase [Halteromyces radiatus]KAI8085154.1 S-adenosyl-L-methionine-dependent methyltransferase [Halteromyces radiatus]
MGNAKSRQSLSKCLDDRSNQTDLYNKSDLNDLKSNSSTSLPIFSSSSLSDDSRRHSEPSMLCDKAPRPWSMPFPSSVRTSNDHHRISTMDENEEFTHRTDMHYLLKHYFHGNFNVPLEGIFNASSSSSSSSSSTLLTQQQTIPPIRILDIFCTTGVWVLEMASDYPKVQCYGIDPGKDYPNSIKPSNAHFSHYDITENNGRMEFEDSFFDFVRMEMIYQCYSKEQWKILCKEMNRILKRGGYFELRDVNPIMKHAGPIAHEGFKRYPQIMKELLGVDVDWYAHMCDYMERYGSMIDIHYKEIRIPIGWSGPPSLLMKKVTESALETHRRKWIKVAAFDAKGLDDYTDNLQLALKEAVDYHSYYNFYLCWGRKSFISQETFLHPTTITDDDHRKKIPSISSENDIYAYGYEE